MLCIFFGDEVYRSFNFSFTVFLLFKKFSKSKKNNNNNLRTYYVVHVPFELYENVGIGNISLIEKGIVSLKIGPRV